MVPAIDKHRLAGLQDGVYSIAMTLLVLELKLPALPEPLTDAALWGALVSVWPKFVTWLLSFWVLALFWTSDARLLASLHAVDRRLLRLGLWRLALVSLLPFSTALMGEHGNHVTPAALYAGHLFLLATVYLARQAHLGHHADAAPSLTPEAARDASLNAWTTAACTAAAFGLAFVVPGYNMLALLPMFFLRLVRRFKG